MEFNKIRGYLLNRLKYTKQKVLKTPRYMLTERVRTYLQNKNGRGIIDIELQEIEHFLKCNLVEVFNAPFVYSYNFRGIKVLWDNTQKLWYVFTPEKRKLYFKRGLTRNQVIQIYNSLDKEQDIHSPHYYFFDSLGLSFNSVVVDIGVAEGNFSLKIVEQVKELYLFECDQDWIEALQVTFAPWKEKVHIIHSFVADKDASGSVCLDTFFQDRQKLDLLKMDVEGAERQVLYGAKCLLEQHKIAELLVCTYHKKNDAEDLSEILIQSGYSVNFSKGYMLFLNDREALPPYDFRRGLLHARITENK